jgi:phage baseplate assembly protein W
MTAMDDPFGIDLAVAVADHRDTAAVDLRIVTGDDGLTDCDRVAGRDNLAQAIRMRLATARGELAHLGHPRYGSRLHLLIGRRLDRTLASLGAAYIREALRDEPRIVRLERLDVVIDHPAGALRFRVAVKPVQGEVLSLDGAVAVEGRP